MPSVCILDRWQMGFPMPANNQSFTSIFESRFLESRHQTEIFFTEVLNFQCHTIMVVYETLEFRFGRIPDAFTCNS